MKNLFGLRLIIILFVFTALSTGCRPVQPADSTRPAQTPAAATLVTTPVLKPADSDAPAAGICASSPEDTVMIAIVTGNMPDPRCLQVTADQRLGFQNETGENVRVQLAQFDIAIPAGEIGVFAAPCGSYLAPGVHRISVSTGSVPEIWLVEE